MNLRPILSIAAALAVLAAMFVVTAGAAPPPPAPKQVFVSHAAIGTGKSCASPGFNSVQAAVDAVASNGTVYLCGTAPFAEQVFLGRSVTVTGDDGSSIAAPATTAGFAPASSTRYPAVFQSDGLAAPQAIVVVTGASTNATIKGIGVAGPLPGVNSCAVDEFGVLVLDGKLSLKESSVTNAQDANPSLNGCQFGVGVQVGRTYWPVADFSDYAVENFGGEATIEKTTVSGYAKNGITVDGAGSDADIHDSTVTGFGPTSQVGQNGIQVSRGADGHVHHNTISANQYTGPGYAFSTGVLVFGGCGDALVTNSEVDDNTLANNDVGVALQNFTDACDAPAATPTKNKVRKNRISSTAVTNVSGFCGGDVSCGGIERGYQAGVEDIGNKDEIADNKISGAGYAPNTTPPAAWVQPIDTTSSPTIAPNVHGNTYTP